LRRGFPENVTGVDKKGMRIKFTSGPMTNLSLNHDLHGGKTMWSLYKEKCCAFSEIIYISVPHAKKRIEKLTRVKRIMLYGSIRVDRGRRGHQSRGTRGS